MESLMRSSRIFPIIVLVLAINAVSKADELTPRLLAENAKADLEKAAVVVLGAVKAIKDMPYPAASAGYRPVEVDLSVKRVLSGRLQSTSDVCFMYMFPYGPYVGARPTWVEPGLTGVFGLLPGDRCMRAVNDRRPIIPTYDDDADDPSVPTTESIARSTLPAKKGCPPDAYELAADTQTVSVPLVGQRFVRNLLEAMVARSDSKRQICACVVMALVWRLDEECLRKLPADTEMLDEIRTTNERISNQERQRLQAAPVSWLSSTIENWGVDGALLRLNHFLARSDMRVTPGTCSSFRNALDSGRLEQSIQSGRERSTATAEDSAIQVLKSWLESGCSADRF